MTDTTDAWQVRASDFPAAGTPAEKLAFALRYAVLAPSSHNTQPWRFRVTDTQVELHADLARGLPVADPQQRELVISCGAALFNLRAALHHFGYRPEVGILPDPARPALLARVRPGVRAAAEDVWQRLFAVIPHRVTVRRPFLEQALPAAFKQELKDAARAENTWLALIVSEAGRQSTTGLVTEGDRRLHANPEFRAELAQWIRPTSAGDGIPAHAQGFSDKLDFATPLMAALVQHFNLGEGIAARDEDLSRHAAALACLWNERDDPAGWLATGQALQRVLLTATAAGYSASFLNQPIEVDELRDQLARFLRIDGRPQLLLRFGVAEAPPHTPRRDASQTLQPDENG